MQILKCDVQTVCTGLAASMGSLLLAGGTKGKRYSLPHSRVMIHQPSGYTAGMASDILIDAREIEKSRQELCEIVSLHTGQPYEKVFNDMNRDFWMNAQEAVDYHIVDKILVKNGSN